MKYFSNILSLILALFGMVFAFNEAWSGAFVAAMVAILLALFDIEDAIRAAAKAKDKDPITTGEVRQRLSGLANRPPPPPKMPVNPFKVGDRVLAFGQHEGTIIGIAGKSVKFFRDNQEAVWIQSIECELICEKQP